MKRSSFAVLCSFLFALPILARDRHQSYVSYDGGQSVIRQTDGREVDARVNVPVYPGDEVETGRRGRTEIRLADGNIVALDRDSALRFQSILDSYEGDANQTVAELLSGSAIVQVLRGDESIRVDTSSGTYVSRQRSLFSIETSSRGGDRVSVFNGSVEVRTPAGTERIRAGERVRVDREGISGESYAASYGNSDFERWYIRRAERYGRSSRYLDRRLAYAHDDLDGYGSWIYVNDYDSWAWRPRVSIGWRPYYHGRWHHSRFGSMVWYSDEPWGWVPYHYGRWAFSPAYGWVWVPGAAYSHAWVYWAFGSNYIGWIPAGWYDCYRPYYNWAYRPYVNTGIDVGFGFYGRVRLANIDHRAWTFVDPNTIYSSRVDQASLTTDVIRDRLSRNGDVATVSNSFPKLSREEIKDPSSAIGRIARRGAGGGTGKDGSGSLVDMTPFFRRDPELPSVIRERIARPVEAAPMRRESPGETSTSSPSGRLSRGGESTPRGGGSTSTETGTRDGGGVITRRPGGGSSPGPADRGEGRTITRRPPSSDESRDRGEIVPRRDDARPEAADPDQGSWRERTIRRDSPTPSEPSRPESAPTWRERGNDGGGVSRPDSGPIGPGRPSETSSDDVPRRVIDRIGGARLEPRDRSPRSSDDGGRVNRGGSARSGESAPRPARVDRPSSPPPQRSSPPPSSSSSGGSGSKSSNIKPKDN